MMGKNKGNRTDSSNSGTPRLFSPMRDYAHLPWSFFSIVLFTIRQRRHNLNDLSVLAFMLLSPWLFLVGFRGKIASTFGTVVVGTREKMKSVAYGAFKSHFCYLAQIEVLTREQAFFPVVVDIGANIGDFTLSMSPRCGKIIAIEPGSENFEYLLSNIAANGVSNVVAINAAAHSRKEIVGLRGTGSNLQVTRVGNGQSAQGLPLDMVLSEMHSEKIDILKIDAQGAEENVLLGMANTLRRKLVHLIIMEVHLHRGMSVEKIESTVKAWGYRPVARDDYLFGQPHVYFLASDI